jgi:cysteinyl-tRNA synthetase
MLLPAPLQFYNSETRNLNVFTPLEAGKVSLYVCGPTVYNDAHLGHARCYITWDVLFRMLQFMGYRVTYARNITDVDDKIIHRAQEAASTPEAIATEYTQRFQEDMAKLNTLEPTQQPKATEHIQPIIQMIETLMAKQHAYALEDGVYFATETMPNYGRLAKKPKDARKAGARVEHKTDKRHPADFALWKRCPEHEYGWPSPWGFGRPGWHIECSAMNAATFGSQLDIHAGGADLMFPHHENEIAQSECCSGQVPYVGVWMHNGFVNVDGEKMSKSLGNFSTVRELMNHYDANTLRYFMLTHHYRSPLDFTPEALEGAKARIQKLEEQLAKALKALPEGMDSSSVLPTAMASVPQDYTVLKDTPYTGFVEALQSDMNTPRALAEWGKAFKALKQAASKEETLATLGDIHAMAWVLGFDFSHITPEKVAPPSTGEGHDIEKTLTIPEALEAYNALLEQFNHPLEQDAYRALHALIQARTQAKQAKNFAQSDALRTALLELGIQLTDLPTGYSRASHM